jgi:hypothetical protein
MKGAVFEDPVLVFAGLNCPVEIESVGEAYAFLCDWPQAKRDAAHSVALKACRAALAEEIDAETARSTFAAFASRHAILAPDMGDVIAARATGALANQMHD